MRWSKLSGMATVWAVAALLAVPGGIAVSSASASVRESVALAPSDDPAPDCAADPGNPACLPPAPDPNPPRHRHGSPVIVGPPLAPFNMPPMAR